MTMQDLESRNEVAAILYLTRYTYLLAKYVAMRQQPDVLSPGSSFSVFWARCVFSSK